MSRPSVIPTWATGGGATVKQPDPNKVDLGWANNAKVQAGFLNWLFNRIGAWITYLDQQSSATQGSFLCNQWSNYAASTGVSNDYFVGLGGTAAVTILDAGTYNAPSARFAVSGAGDEALIGTPSNRVFINASYQLATFTQDIAMSSVGANALTINSGCYDGTGDPVTNGAAFYKQNGNTNWQCITHDGVASTVTDSGVPPVAATFQRLTIILYGSAQPSGPKVEFYIDGTLVSTHTTNVDVTDNMKILTCILSAAGTGHTVTLGRGALQWARASGL